MKKVKPFRELLNRSLKKTFLTMRIAAFLLILGILQAYAADSYAQITKLSLDFSDTELIKVLDNIEIESEFYFLYNEKLLDTDRKVDISANDQMIDVILDKLFAGTDVKYTIIDRKIILAPDYLTKETDLSNHTQQQTITGTVTETSTGSAMPGVNVQIKGTTIGTITDTQGKYSLTVTERNAVLIFSFIGYITQEIPLSGRTTIDVGLTSDLTTLEEVVVVGYGIAKKVNLTGSFSSVTSTDLETITTSNMVTGLAGQLPGLRVKQSTGEPGAYTTTFDIRGYGNPLIVIDGTVTDQKTFVRLNPKDIDQMTIIKDASAAVYGVQAANGVILISTKKGTEGKPRISYSGYYQLQKITNAPKLGDAYSYATIMTEYEINRGRTPGATTFTPEDIQKFKDGTYPSTDWYGLVVRDNTYQNNHYLSFSGGSDKIKYFSSIGYMDEMGLWKSGDLNYNKFNLRSNITSKITDNLEVELNVDGLLDNKNELAWNSWYIFTSLYWQDPTKPAFTNNNPDYFIDCPGGLHSVPLTDSDYGYLKTNNKTFNGILKAVWKLPFITDGLSAKLAYSFYNNELL